MTESLLTIGIAVLVFALPVCWRYVQVRRSDSWSQLQATVEGTNVRVQSQGEHSTILAEVTYSYSFEGEYYAGFYSRKAGTVENGWRLLEPFPKGMPVTIRVDPNHPDKSIYREDDNRSLLLRD